MDVVDKPSMADMPDFGSFVVVSLDPVASVAALEDEQATQEAAAMIPGKYLALVNLPGEMVYSSEIDDIELCLSFLLVSHGLPKPPYAKAAVPIAPAPPHPDLDPDRAPVHASSPLPWADCYFHTLERVTATVSRIYLHSTTGPSFTEDEHDEIRYMSGMDTRAYPAFGARVPEVVEEHGSNVALSFSQHGHLEPDVRNVVLDDTPFFPVQCKEGIPMMRIHAQMWLDITAFDTHDHPENIHAEQRRLVEIERQWARRAVRKMMSKEPQTTAWLQGAAGADAPELDEDGRSVSLDDDELIGPDDAIEHRAERMMLEDADRDPDDESDVRRSISPIQRGVDVAQSSASGISVSSSSSHHSVAASASSGADALTPRNWGGLSAFRWILSNLGSVFSRARSYFWSILWRRPFAK